MVNDVSLAPYSFDPGMAPVSASHTVQ